MLALKRSLATLRADSPRDVHLCSHPPCSYPRAMAPALQKLKMEEVHVEQLRLQLRRAEETMTVSARMGLQQCQPANAGVVFRLRQQLRTAEEAVARRQWQQHLETHQQSTNLRAAQQLETQLALARCTALRSMGALALTKYVDHSWESEHEALAMESP